VSLFAASIGIADYVSRLVADVLKVGYLRDSKRWTESRIYSSIVWTIALFGVAILLAGFDQPLVLTVLAASLCGVVMFTGASCHSPSRSAACGSALWHGALPSSACSR
jgi:hypothetical protein